MQWIYLDEYDLNKKKKRRQLTHQWSLIPSSFRLFSPFCCLSNTNNASVASTPCDFKLWVTNHYIYIPRTPQMYEIAFCQSTVPHETFHSGSFTPDNFAAPVRLYFKIFRCYSRANKILQTHCSIYYVEASERALPTHYLSLLNLSYKDEVNKKTSSSKWGPLFCKPGEKQNFTRLRQNITSLHMQQNNNIKYLKNTDCLRA